MNAAKPGARGVLIVQEDTVIKGEIRNCRHVDVFGYVEGQLAAEKVHVHPGGRLHGKIRTDAADVHGTLQGEVVVRNLINIRSSGTVEGNVQYGQLAMETGGNLSADVRNVPPSVTGDLEISVERGRSVKVTLVDLNAVDPDDTSQNLTFAVSNARSGFVALASAPGRAVAMFLQADLEGGRVVFVHDGSGGETASFDVVVTDSQGATSGAPKTVTVRVKPRA